MKGLNKVQLIGRLGQDPEIRYTQSETAVANFSLATGTPVKRDDEWQEETEWHKIVAWGRLAEICGEYLNKGSLVYIEGRLRTRQWEDADGNKRWTTEVVARDLIMLGSATSNGDAGEPSNEDVPPPGDDDVPF